MGNLFAIDFGTTNSVIARWDSARGCAIIERLPGLSTTQPDLPPIIPSLLYVADGAAGKTVAGQAARNHEAEEEQVARLFHSFKRGVVSGGDPTPRQIDGCAWTDHDAGQHFLRAMLAALPDYPERVDQVIVSAPVASFGSYVAWLAASLPGIPAGHIHVVDESTAAALGYAVTRPGALVLVLDFGGGTLDISLVELPASRGKTGGLLNQLLAGRSTPTARVVARAGCIIGGSDVDAWLLEAVLQQAGLGGISGDAGWRSALLLHCERIKIALSSVESAICQFAADGRMYSVTVTREMLEALLTRQGFFTALHATLERIMQTARRQGVFREDIQHVLLVGGTALMPSVRTQLASIFPTSSIHADKPFTAVAEGALLVAAGYGLDDYLSTSIGLRHRDPVTGQIAVDEIIPEDTRYPMPEPVSVLLGPSSPDQTAIDLVVSALASETAAAIDIQMQDGQTVFVAQTDHAAQQVTPLNAADPVRITPAGPVRALFSVDEERQLRVTVTDPAGRTTLLDNQIITRLGDIPVEKMPTGRSLIPQGVDDLAAYFRDRIAAAAAGLADTREEATPPHLQPTGYEPALSAERPHGQQRLSLRRLGAMLGVLPPGAITLPAASAMLESPDFYVRYNAGRLLARRGDRPARQVLAAALTSDSAPTRASAARHLYGFTWHAAAPLIAQALADADLRVREAAIYALCDLRTPPAYRRAAEALYQQEDVLRAAAAWALREDTAPQAVPVLQAALLAENPDIRVQALEALGVNATPAALTAVRAQIAADPSPEVQYAAALSLLEIAEAAALNELADLIREASGARREALLRALFHASNYLKLDMAASDALAPLLEALAAALSDPDPAARMAAVWPLAWLSDERATPILVHAYTQETDPDVRSHMRRVCRSLMSPAAAALAGADAT